MKKNLPIFIFALVCLFASPRVYSQMAFKNANAKLNSAGHSGCPVTIVDWNGDGLDDIIRLDDGKDLFIEVQRTNNTFETFSFGSFSTSSAWAWAMCAADIDHNGFKDVVAGGGSSSVRIMMMNSNGTAASLVYLDSSNFFLQNLTFADFNNDGWIDLFCCDDNAESHIYLNDGAGNLNPSQIINFDVTTTDDSGNYGSVWTDFDNDGDLDLYIAKCRQNVNNPADGRRINVMFVNDGNNVYTEMAGVYGLNIGWQSWTASFGDIDNDADLDLMVTNHDHESQILQNDGTGHYTDITSSTGFDLTDITPIESVMEDFDNDGWIDIMATGSDSRFFKNNGNGTFTKITGLFDNNDMESFSIGDLNHDGSIDIYGSYANIYTTPTSIDDVVWLNKGNTNHFITLNLKGTVSNHDAIGARALIYGDWGVQLREVKAGESYGTVNSSMLHFGIGQSTSVDSVVIKWPSGNSQTIINPSPDQFLTIKENDCVSPEAIVTYTGTLILCTGQTITLQAPAGFDYVWSTTEVTQSIVVNQPGEYNVMISFAGNNCPAISKTLEIELNPDQTPLINADNVTEFCNGNSVNLLAPAGYLSYLWSNGTSNQNANITQSGTYSVNVLGDCQVWNSAAITVVVHTAIDPVVSDVTLPAPGSATLNAVGQNISWFDVQTGGISIASGNVFNTPVLADTTTYYVEAAETYGGGNFATGKPYHTGTSIYSGTNSTNATTSFDILETCYLNSVKVYTDIAGFRTIELRDYAGTLLQSAYVNIVPDTQVISLNWLIPVGIGYTLGTDAATNNAIVGWANDGPRLRRNNTDVTYPYTINGLIDITGSSVGGTYYYYFYDWQVEKVTYSCPSNRLPVNVNVNNSVGINSILDIGISLYPNPASDKVMVVFNQELKGNLSLYDFTGRLVKSEEVNGNKKLVDITGIVSGVYQIKIETLGGTRFLKFVID